MKYSFKLSISFTTLLLISVSLISYFAWRSRVNIVTNSVVNSLESAAFHTINKIDRMLFERYQDIQLIASDPVIASKDSTSKEITDRLIIFRNLEKTYVSLSFFDFNRRRIADTTGLELGQQHSLEGYWSDVLRGRVSAAKDVGIAKDLRFEVINFASPVKDKTGQLFGVVVARVPIRAIYSILSESTYSDLSKDGVLVDLISKDGLLLYSNHMRQDVLKKTLPGWKIIADAVRNCETGYIENSYMAEQRYITVFAKEKGYLDFSGNNWILVLRMPERIAFAAASKLKNSLIILSTFVVFLTILVTLYISRSFSLPLVILNEATKRLSAGDLDYKIKIKGKDEIGDLARSFNEMAYKLRSFYGELDRSVREKTKEYSVKVNELEDTKAAILNVIDDLNIKKAELEKAHEELEEKVELRTAELKIANEELKRSASELVGANQVKTEFLANMSHELRTPLNSVIGFSEVLFDGTFGKLNAKQSEYAADILLSGKHLLSLINDILDISKVEAGKMEIILSTFSLNDLLANSLILLKGRSFKQNISISIDMEEGIDLIISDEKRLKQIIYNLLSNAVKFTPEGGKILIRVKKIDDMLEFSVSDTGIGIDPEYLDKVFNEFFRIENEFTRKFEGSGLGLTLTKKILELLGGNIQVESPGLGKGSTFKFTLPFKSAG